jgi:TPP-dependent pyruvate/acetoin dehydrogenase alpha subunit
MGSAKKAAKVDEIFPGIEPETAREWFRITQLGRLIEDKASGYIRKAMGWSFHAPFAGHDGIQLALGLHLGWLFDPTKTSCFRTTGIC